MSRKSITKDQKAIISTRAGERCEYCRSMRKYSPQPFVVEHIIPISKGGKTSMDNLALACGGCNGHKYNKTEGLDTVNGKKVTLFNPRKNNWSDHFTWSRDQLKIIGISPQGRATVYALKLNRAELLNLREMNLLTGEHPPE